MSELPDDIIKSLLAIGRVEWGTSLYQTDEKHVEDLRDTLRLTREHFGMEESETAIHGVYLDGTGIVLAHTGNSPNSPQHARILAGAWNHLVDLAQAQKFVEDGAQAAAEGPALDAENSTTTREVEPFNGAENV